MRLLRRKRPDPLSVGRNACAWERAISVQTLLEALAYARMHRARAKSCNSERSASRKPTGRSGRRANDSKPSAHTAKVLHSARRAGVASTETMADVHATHGSSPRRLQD